MIYLDHHATTPCDARVVEKMLPYFSIHFGNASSAHEMGSRASQAVEAAREEVAALIGAQPDEIVFTSGATEANNLAIFGVARGVYATSTQATRRRMLATPLEHKSVSQPLRAMEDEGFKIHSLPVARDGRVEISAARKVLNASTLLASIQAASGEIGTIQPLRELSELAHGSGVLMHCDASQAVGKIPFDVEVLDLDLASLSAHKIYGPKGIGALWVRRGLRKILAPQTIGGGQEKGLRAGTLPVPLIIGLGEACRICRKEMNDEAARLQTLRDEMEGEIQSAWPETQINGAKETRLPHNSSLTFPNLPADALLARLNDIALSTGSACDSGAPEPSRTLTSIGLTRAAAASTIRIGLGRDSKREEVLFAAARLTQVARELQDLLND